MYYRSIALATVLQTATLCLPTFAHAADNYKIDSRHTSIVFSVGHAELSYTYGMFLRSRGAYSIDKEKPANSRFQIEIEADSLFTNDVERDKHLRSPDFFNVNQFPMITFETIACDVKNTVRGPQFLLTGNLTMHGVTKQIELPLQMLAEKKGPQGDPRTGFLCQLKLLRTDFGIANGLIDKTSIGDAVSITISFEGVLDTAGAAAAAATIRRQ
jgi:polyisoprenoid-binding protein YceI